MATRLRNPLERTLTSVSVYRKHIIEIWNILKENCDQPSIRTSNYSYSDLEEFLGDREQSNQMPIYIQTHSPDLSIKIHKRNVEIYAFNDDVASSGLFHSVERVLIAAQRPFGKFLDRFWLRGFVWSFYILLSFGLLIPELKNFFETHKAAYGILYASCTLYVWAASFGVFRKTKIHLRPGQESQNFFQRNADSILVALISAIVGAMLSLLFPKLIGVGPPS